MRTKPFVENLREAIKTLDWYRTDFAGIVTSRLHTYLPARSLGIPIKFLAKNPADIRFEGLIGISSQQLASMRSALLEKLSSVFALVLGGAREDVVREQWRALCADDVALAREQFSAPVSPVLKSFDLDVEVARVLAARVDIPASASGTSGSAVHIEVSLDGNLKHQLSVVIDALERHSARPLHLYVLSRDHVAADHERVAGLFPRVTFTWLPCDEVNYGSDVNLLRHLTVATMDRLLLPELLPDVAKILHLDLDTLPCDDIGKLYDIELGEAPLAARTVVWEVTSSGVGRYFEQLQRVPADRSSTFLRLALRRHGFDFEAFSAGIMVLNLERMRKDAFCRNFLPYVETFGLNDQQALNLYAGPERVALDRRWNLSPRQDMIVDPGIIHWAGACKPWESEYVLCKEDWQEAEARLAARVTGAGLGGRPTGTQPRDGR